MPSSKRPPYRSRALSRRPDRLIAPVVRRRSYTPKVDHAEPAPHAPEVRPVAHGKEPTVSIPKQRAEGNGYFALKTEFLGADRILDVLYDAAPDDLAVDYRGYLDITSVKWNNVELMTYDAHGRLNGPLTESDLEAIKEEIEDLKSPGRDILGDLG